jgi:hypothetical protein
VCSLLPDYTGRKGQALLATLPTLLPSFARATTYTQSTESHIPISPCKGKGRCCSCSGHIYERPLLERSLHRRVALAAGLLAIAVHRRSISCVSHISQDRGLRFNLLALLEDVRVGHHSPGASLVQSWSRFFRSRAAWPCSVAWVPKPRTDSSGIISCGGRCRRRCSSACARRDCRVDLVAHRERVVRVAH